ncbi:hypothetical protein [Dactylosporangium sp. CA-092794]|uniref:hypothetical protein n=1 Tax=Dactylosporangium sp. CA-092794 TaxID=3239929 RepID=UPI003D8C168D
MIALLAIILANHARRSKGKIRERLKRPDGPARAPTLAGADIDADMDYPNLRTG